MVKNSENGTEDLSTLVLLAQDLGETACRLAEQVDEMYERIARMGVEDSIAEPGHYYHVVSYLNEDPMDVEAYDPGTDSYDPPCWRRLSPAEYESRSNLHQDKGGRNEWVLIGHRISYDPEARKLRIYDSTDQLRVNYRKGILVRDGLLGDSASPAQRLPKAPHVMMN